MHNDKNNENEQSKPVNIKVSESQFINAIKEVDKMAFQAWVNDKGWLLTGESNYSLQVWIFDGYVTIKPHGYGSCQSLIAKTPEELIECCEMWWRNR